MRPTADRGFWGSCSKLKSWPTGDFTGHAANDHFLGSRSGGERRPGAAWRLSLAGALDCCLLGDSERIVDRVIDSAFRRTRARASVVVAL